jgi:hypothetical protein
LKKLSVYLDQNAVSNLARATDWPKTELGGALLSSAIDVFVSPVHVLETMQAEEGVRSGLAKTQLTDDGSLLNALRPIAGRLSSPERPVEVCASRDFAKLAAKMSR